MGWPYESSSQCRDGYSYGELRIGRSKNRLVMSPRCAPARIGTAIPVSPSCQMFSPHFPAQSEGYAASDIEPWCPQAGELSHVEAPPNNAWHDSIQADASPRNLIPRTNPCPCTDLQVALIVSYLQELTPCRTLEDPAVRATTPTELQPPTLPNRRRFTAQPRRVVQQMPSTDALLDEARHPTSRATH